MTQQLIGIGTAANDGTGDSLRLGGDKINDNFTELYGLLSETINSAGFPGATDVEKIQSAINQAVATAAERVFVPTAMLPYDASLITFADAVQMVREGGDASLYDVQAYGAAGDGVTDDTVALRATINAAVAAGTALGPTTHAIPVYFPPGVYYVHGNPFLPAIGSGSTPHPLTVTLGGAQISTTVQIKVPQQCVVSGGGRTGSGFISPGAAPNFIASVAIASVVRTTNVVTVTTSTDHGLEVTATAVLSGVTDTSFDGGWQVVAVPTSASFTFAQVAGDASSSSGTVYIPLCVLGDNDPFNFGTRLENMSVRLNGETGSVGVYSNNIQELSGAEHLTIVNAAKYGIWIERSGAGRPYSYRFEDVEIYLTPYVGATGVYIRGQYTNHRGLEHVSVVPLNAVVVDGIAAGFDLSGAPGLYTRLHIEGATNAIVIGDSGLGAAYDTDSSGMVFSGVVGHDTVTTLFRLKNYANVHDIVIEGARKNAGTTMLVDEIASITLTDEALALYVIGAQGGTRMSTAPTVPWVLAKGTTTPVILLPSAGVATLRTDTVDGSDDAVLKIVPTSSASSSRGAVLQLAGNENAALGLAQIASGDVTGSVVNLFNGVTGTGVVISSTQVTAQLPLITKATAAGASGARLPHGTAPSSPVDGDMWTTTAGLYVRINGATVGPLS